MDREEPTAPSWDHKNIPIEEIPFSDWIELPAAPSHDLDWSSELQKAREWVKVGKKIVWKFDLGLEALFFPLEEELRFQAIALGLKQFSQSVWPEFKDSTLALALYRGSADWSQGFLWTEKQEANFHLWLDEEELIDTPHARKLFAADAFAIYFQMLSHRLPDEVPIFLLFDIRSFSSPSEALQIISKERFEHFLVALKDKSMLLDGFVWDEKGIKRRHVESAKGLVFPERRGFESAFDQLLLAHPDGKILFETFLIEDWEGIDQLVVIADSIGMQGARKLKGFSAAGGEVIVTR